MKPPKIEPLAYEITVECDHCGKQEEIQLYSIPIPLPPLSDKSEYLQRGWIAEFFLDFCSWACRDAYLTARREDFPIYHRFGSEEPPTLPGRYQFWGRRYGHYLGAKNIEVEVVRDEITAALSVMESYPVGLDFYKGRWWGPGVKSDD